MNRVVDRQITKLIKRTGRHIDETGFENLRVAIVLSELRPGGMERLVVHLSKGLDSRDIRVMIFCLQNPGELAEELKGTGVKIVALKSFSGKDIRSVWNLGKLLKTYKPSLINIHDYSSAPYAVISSRLFVRVPLVFTAHGLLYQGFDHLRNRYRFFSKFFSSLTVVSEAVGVRHQEYLDWKKPVRVIPNGVPGFKKNKKAREKIRGEFGVLKTDILFLAVGNPRPEKGFEDLIQAAALLKISSGNEKGFKVAVAGKLKNDPYCRMLAETLDRENLADIFLFLGFRSDTEALYNAADVFVLSSRSEGLPMVILEAMMAGLPVIATRVGGIPDMMGDKGILVKPDDPRALCAAMAYCLDNGFEMEKIAKKGKTLVQTHYGIDQMVDAYLNTYQALTEKK